jgi:cell division protein FtsB|tara:strand:+ start:201 stop:332 length:132 start_codon:yes stop_codon:yes gene_type:complete
MSKEEIEELKQRVKELEWQVKHLKDLNRIDPISGEWKDSYLRG